MKPEKKWQVISGISLLLFVLACMVAAWQVHQIRLLRSAGTTKREVRSEPGSTVVLTTAPANAGADAQTDQAIAHEVDRRIAQFHRDLAAKRSKEVKTLFAAEKQFTLSPDTQKRASEAFRASLKVRYGPLYSALGFSEHEIATFERVMMERFWVVSDFVSAAHLSGPYDPGLARLSSRELEAVDARLESLLGGEKFRALRNFDASADARTVVETLAGRIASSGASLSQSQMEQFVAIAASAQRSPPKQDDWLKAAVFGRSSTISFNDMDWTKIEEDQLGFLSPPQRTIMSAFLTDAQKRQAIRDDLKRVERETRETLAREAGSK